MARERDCRTAEPRCDNCCFSTYATGAGRAALICRQKKGSEGTWNIRPLRHSCANFYPSRAADIRSRSPRLIPLTRGRFTIVDAEDYTRLSRYTWFAEGTDKNCYAVRKENGQSIKMHREITCDNKTYHLGYFHDEAEAARAYDRKAAELFGQFASLNFPPCHSECSEAK